MDEKYLYDRENVYQDFNPKMEHEWVEYEFEGQRYRVYKNANVSIFLTDYCNACCKFCIEQVEYRNKKDMLLKKPHICDDNEYLRRIEYILSVIRPLNTSLSITGGEPTLSPRFVKVLKLIKKFNFRKVTINTNGSGLLDVVDGIPVYQHIIDCGVNHVNISRHHWKDEVINELMRFEHRPCSTDMLKTVIPELLKKGVRPRINCVVLKNGVDSIEDMVHFLEFYTDIGINNIVFRQMMEYNSAYVKNSEIVDFYKDNLTTIDRLWTQMDEDSRFSKVKNIRGRYYYVEIWKYRNIDIVTERASSEVKNRDIGIDEEHLVYEMVIHPAGTLTKGWYYKKGILLNYETE